MATFSTQSNEEKYVVKIYDYSSDDNIYEAMINEKQVYEHLGSKCPQITRFYNLYLDSEQKKGYMVQEYAG